VTVVDWCETPLMLSRWYAARVAHSVRTVRSNVLDLRAPGRFDLISTNSFLGYFTSEQRQPLFAVWAEALLLGGKAILSNRTRPSFETDRVGFNPEEARRFCEEVDARADGAGIELGIDPKAIAAGVRDRVRNFAVQLVSVH